MRSSGQAPPYKVEVDVGGKSLTMEVDTGASLSLVSESTFKKQWPKEKLSPSKAKLCSYSGESIPVLGSKCNTVGRLLGYHC